MPNQPNKNKKKKSSGVKPIFHKEGKGTKFLKSAATVLGGPGVWAAKAYQSIKKQRVESGMDPKKRGGHLSQYD